MKNSRDGIIGLAIGDAMGVPLKFVAREKLLEKPVTEMISGGVFNKRKGTWSDSTSLTLATIDSIINSFGVSVLDMAGRFVDWMQNGRYTVDGKRFNIGKTTFVALSKFQRIDEQLESGSVNEESNGNDALIRMLPIAYYAYSANLQKNDIYELVKKVCYITHAHEISVLGCYIYVNFAIKLLEGKSKIEAYSEIQQMSYIHFSRSSNELYSRIIKKDIRKLSINDIKTTGYIVDSLEAIFWIILNTQNFNQAIIGSVNLGNETERTAAAVGGLAGIIYGLKDINLDWRIDLKKYSNIRKICEKFDEVLKSSSQKFQKEELVYGNEEKIIKIIQGDITKLNVDAYVNAANNSLLGGMGVDGAIHRAAGPKLLEKCQELSGCETGEAKITKGYDSKAKYIIHTVAPKWYEKLSTDREKLLRNCYENSLILANDFNCRSVAFPCLGMGTYGCPIDIGGKIALDVVIGEARKSKPLVESIYLICYNKEEYEFYMEYFKEKISENPAKK